MSDAEHLLVILAVLYLGECGVWIRPGAAIVSSQVGCWFRFANLQFALLRNHRGGLLFGNLFATGETFVCEQWPLSLSAEGVFAFVSQLPSSDARPDATERFILFRDLKKVEFQDQRVFLNGVEFVRVASAALARSLAGLISQLHAAPADERGPLIHAAIRRHLDVDAARQRLRSFRRSTRDLRLTTLVMTFLVLVYPPIVYWLDPFVHMGQFVVAYLLLHVLAIAQFWVAHVAFYAGQWKERLKFVLVMFVSPADAMHGRDKLSRPLLADVHPLVAAKLLCPAATFDELAAAAWRDLRHPIWPVCPTDDTGPKEVEEWFRESFTHEFESFLAAFGFDSHAAESAPPKYGADVRSFCERCQGQFEIAEGSCHGCGDRPLTPFA